MVSLVWIRCKTRVCEVCGRVMEINEPYADRCKNCHSDFCCNCGSQHGLCKSCADSSLSQAGFRPGYGVKVGGGL